MGYTKILGSLGENMGLYEEQGRGKPTMLRTVRRLGNVAKYDGTATRIFRYLYQISSISYFGHCLTVTQLSRTIGLEGDYLLGRACS
jgi:hypothetical protein